MFRQQRFHLAVGLLILIVAASARIWSLGEAPPGLQHDEIFKAEEAIRLVEQGDVRLFYPSNQGHEGGFVWLLAISYVLFGTTLLMIRFPPLVCGLLTVALLYRIAAEQHGHRVAAIAAGMGAVSFWAIFTSRVGLRAVSLPVIVLLVIWGVWRVCYYRPSQSNPRGRLAILTGIALGSAIYTYTSSFVLYIAYVIFVVALGLFDRDTLKQHYQELLLIGLIGATLTLPMINIRLNDPQGQNRTSSITRPLQSFLEGDRLELLENARGLAGMPYFTGDPEWRYNVAGRPLFASPVGLLVYAGLGLAIWRIRRQPIYVLWLAVALVGLIPSLFTVQAPSFLRSIVILPAVMLFIAIAIERIAGLIARGHASQATWVFGLIAIVATAATDWPAYFIDWPQNDEVNSIYRDDLEQLATYLRDRDESLVIVSTPNTEIDPLLYKYLNSPSTSTTQVVFFDGRVDIALRSQPTLLFISPLADISPPHAEWLADTNGTTSLGVLSRQDGTKAFDLYRLADGTSSLPERLAQVSQWPIFLGSDADFPSGELADWGIPFGFPVNFGDTLQLIGLEVPRQEIYSEYDGVNIQLYFQPLIQQQNLPLNVFVHLLRPDGTVAAQRDLLGVPSASWHPEIIFIQDNFVVAGSLDPGRYFLTMGVYNWQNGQRLSVLDESGEYLADKIMITQIDVVPRE